MDDRVERLVTGDEPAIVRLLEREPVLNLFLLGFVELHGVSRGTWYGAFEDGDLNGLVLLIPGRLAVPYCPDPADADRIGRRMQTRHRPTLVVGPRDASDAMWARWTRNRKPKRLYDQRLYSVEAPPTGRDPEGFRRAVYEEWPIVAEYTAAMEREDLGRDPAKEEPERHDEVVKERVKSGRTWVTANDDDIVFQVNVGSAHAIGSQIGGTYVPAQYRGLGHAKAGVAAIVRRLLTRYPRVTLHVNEDNLPAVRVYEHCGFRRDAPMRLITP